MPVAVPMTMTDLKLIRTSPFQSAQSSPSPVKAGFLVTLELAGRQHQVEVGAAPKTPEAELTKRALEKLAPRHPEARTALEALNKTAGRESTVPGARGLAGGTLRALGPVGIIAGVIADSVECGRARSPEEVNALARAIDRGQMVPEQLGLCTDLVKQVQRARLKELLGMPDA